MDVRFCASRRASGSEGIGYGAAARTAASILAFMSGSLDETITERTAPLSVNVMRAVAVLPAESVGVSQTRLILFSKSLLAVDAIFFASAFFCAASSAAFLADEALASSAARSRASASDLALASALAFASAAALFFLLDVHAACF